MKISAVNMYSQNNCECKRKANPNFGNIYFTPDAAKKLPDILLSFDSITIKHFTKSLSKLIKQAEGLPDIVVGYAAKTNKLIAKLSKITKEGYGLKSFAQQNLSDTSFLENAVEYAKRVKAIRSMPDLPIKTNS